MKTPAQYGRGGFIVCLVAAAGLEPASPEAKVFKTFVYTSSTTRPALVSLPNAGLSVRWQGIGGSYPQFE